MIQDISRAETQAEAAAFIADLREYAAVPHRADYDDYYGGELSVPIIYEPV